MQSAFTQPTGTPSPSGPTLESPPRLPVAGADGGELFAKEFQRATGADEASVAEVRHGERRTAEANREDRQGSQDTAQRARADARSEREKAGEARRTRSEARQDERPEGLVEAPFASRPGLERALSTEASSGRRTAAPETRLESGGTETNAGASEASQAAASSSLAAPAPVGPPSGTAANSTHSHTNNTAAAARPTAIAAPASSGQANAGNLGQRDPSVPELSPGGKAEAAAPEADAMERLLVEREARIHREAAILRQLHAQLAPGRREISLQLNPASLGRMHLNIALRGGRMTAVLRAETSEALGAIERQLPELQASLEAQGFEVMNFDLELAPDLGADSGPGNGEPNASPAALVPPAPSRQPRPGLPENPLSERRSSASSRTPSKSSPTPGGVDFLV